MSRYDGVCPRCSNHEADENAEEGFQRPNTVKFANLEDEFNLYVCRKCGLAFLESKTGTEDDE